MCGPPSSLSPLLLPLGMFLARLIVDPWLVLATRAIGVSHLVAIAGASSGQSSSASSAGVGAQATPEMFLLHCAIVDPHLCYHCPHLGCFLRMLLLTHPHLVVMAAAACDICCHGLVAIVAATLEWSGYSCPRSHLGSCSHLGLFLLSCHYWPSSCHHRCYHLGL